MSTVRPEDVVYTSQRGMRVHLVNHTSAITAAGIPGTVKTVCARTTARAVPAALADWETWPCEQCKGGDA